MDARGSAADSSVPSAPPLPLVGLSQRSPSPIERHLAPVQHARHLRSGREVSQRGTTNHTPWTSGLSLATTARAGLAAMASQLIAVRVM